MRVTIPAKTYEIERCFGCPFYWEEQDMQMTIPVCTHPDIDTSKNSYAGADIIDRATKMSGFPEKCPLKNSKEKHEQRRSIRC